MSRSNQRASSSGACLPRTNRSPASIPRIHDLQSRSVRLDSIPMSENCHPLVCRGRAGGAGSAGTCPRPARAGRASAPATVCRSVCVCLSAPVCVCRSVCVGLSAPVYPSFRPSVHPSIHPSIWRARVCGGLLPPPAPPPLRLPRAAEVGHVQCERACARARVCARACVRVRACACVLPKMSMDEAMTEKMQKPKREER